MAKKVLTLIKLQIPAGAANPAPPVGPALGQHGVNIMEFCKAFNSRTQADAGTIIPVEITVFEDRSFDFITKTPPAAVLIREALAIPKGSGEPNREKVGTPDRGPVPRDRRAQDARPERQRPRRRLEDHRRHRPLDGRRSSKGSTPRWPASRGKRYREALGQDRPHPRLPAGRGDRSGQADRAARSSTRRVEVHMRLGVNVRHAEEQLRGTLALPNGLGKQITVAVFAEGDAARAATEAGADFVGAKDLADRVEEGWTDFDVAIATPGADGPGGLEARPRARPAGQDAEPEGGHGHRRRRQGRHRGEGRQGRVPHRPPGDRPPDDRQGELRRARPARELRRDHRRDRPRQAGCRQGPLPALDHPGDDDGPRGPRRLRRAPASQRSSPTWRRATAARPRAPADEADGPADAEPAAAAS